MHVYTLLGGDKVEAKDAHDLVRKMRQLAFVPSRSIKEYMEEVAERARMSDVNAKIPTDNEADFVEALLDAGIIKMVEEVA